MAKSAPPAEFQNTHTFRRIGTRCRPAVRRLTRAGGATYPAEAGRRARPTHGEAARAVSAAAVRRGVVLETFWKFVSLSPGHVLRNNEQRGVREAFRFQGACR